MAGISAAKGRRSDVLFPAAEEVNFHLVLRS